MPTTYGGSSSSKANNPSKAGGSVGGASAKNGKKNTSGGKLQHAGKADAKKQNSSKLLTKKVAIPDKGRRSLRKGAESDEDDDGVDKEFGSKKVKNQRWNIGSDLEKYEMVHKGDSLSDLRKLSWGKKLEKLQAKYEDFLKIAHEQPPKSLTAPAPATSSAVNASTSSKIAATTESKRPAGPTDAEKAMAAWRKQHNARKETCMNGFRRLWAAISDDGSRDAEVASVSLIRRHYPHVWNLDDAKSNAADPGGSYAGRDVGEWFEGEEYCVRTSWPISLPEIKKPQVQEQVRTLLEGDEESCKKILKLGSDLAEKQKKLVLDSRQNRLYHGVWRKYYSGAGAAATRRRVLQAQRNWHGAFFTTEEQSANEARQKNQPRAAVPDTKEEKEENTREIKRRLQCCLTETLQPEGGLQLINATQAGENLKRTIGGDCLVQLVGAVEHRRTGTEGRGVVDSATNKTHRFEAECRRQKVIIPLLALQPLSKFLPSQLPASVEQNLRTKRCVFAMRKVYEAATRKTSKSRASQLPKFFAGEELRGDKGDEPEFVFNPASKTAKRVKGEQRSAEQAELMAKALRQTSRKDALPKGFFKQAAQEPEHIKTKMQKVVDLCMTRVESGFPTAERSNIYATGKVNFLGMGLTDFRQKPDTIAAKFDDKWKKKVWDACADVAEAVAKDRAAKGVGGFFWTGIGIGLDVQTPVHIDGKNSAPSATFSGGTYSNGAEGYPCGRLFVHDSGEEGGDPFWYPITIPLSRYDGRDWQQGEGIRGKFLETYLTWVRFSGKRAHATEPWAKGHRVCVVYFSKPVTSPELYKLLKERRANPPPVVSLEAAQRAENGES
ncbi:unnamed protein product [Amoebophrya sp. A120]|nr:unnamed protein product [Amoebophrya sp. A120]|eukprot:GSA120T00002396001.1